MIERLLRRPQQAELPQHLCETPDCDMEARSAEYNKIVTDREALLKPLTLRQRATSISGAIIGVALLTTGVVDILYYHIVDDASRHQEANNVYPMSYSRQEIKSAHFWFNSEYFSAENQRIRSISDSTRKLRNQYFDQISPPLGVSVGRTVADASSAILGLTTLFLTRPKRSYKD